MLGADEGVWDEERGRVREEKTSERRTGGEGEREGGRSEDGSEEDAGGGCVQSV